MSKAILRRAPLPITMSRVVGKGGADVVAPLPVREFFVIEVSGGSPGRAPTTRLPGVARGRRVPRDSSPRPLQFFCTCGTCGRGLSASRDIYVYKVDIAFCSQDCREHRMQWDT